MHNLFDFTEFEIEKHGEIINQILDKVKSNSNCKQWETVHWVLL